MNIYDATITWNVKENTVFSYIMKGFIPNLRIDNNIIMLPDIKKPYIPRRKLKNIHEFDRAIIKAFEQDCYVNAAMLGLSKQSFSERMKALELAGSIIAHEHENKDYDSNEGFYLASKVKNDININVNGPVDIKIADQIGVINGSIG